MKLRAHRWEANGLVHNVLERPQSSEDAPTALLLHGFQDAAATWGDVAEQLGDGGLRVLVPDLRGFGDGPRAPPGAYYFFPDYVADAVALARAHARGALFVVGHSMGATVATYVAGAFPERVAKLALVDGVGALDHPFEAAPLRMRGWIEGVEDVHRGGKRRTMSRDDALARLSRNNPHVPAATLDAKLEHLVRPAGEDGKVTWKYDPLHATTSPVPFYAEAYKAFARRVTCPVLHVSGGPRGFHVPDEDERLAFFATLTRVTIDGGHMLHWSRPAELAAALLAFWNGPGAEA